MLTEQSEGLTRDSAPRNRLAPHTYDVQRGVQLSSREAKLIGALALAIIASLDYVTEAQLRVGVFYLVPVVLVAWYVGLQWGAAYACVAGTLSVARMLMVGHLYSYPIYFCYEAAVTYAILLGANYLVATLRQAQNSLLKLARHDSLTGLVNRATFLERLELELARHRRLARPLSVVVLDCDDFKAVNDARGHLEGDRLLRVVGAALRSALRKTDLACRLGGDEFALLFPETDAATARTVIEGLRARLHKAISGHGWSTSFSAGVAVYENVPATAEAALKGADRLMYDVKRAGKRRYKLEVV
jgi:diguanylate cyclase (GGDEF)-like protein